jgi:hypothetical protein
VEDLKGFDTAIEYLSNLNSDVVALHLYRYGFTLVSNQPEKMTELLMKILTESDGQLGDLVRNPERFVHFYVNQPKWGSVFLERVLSSLFQLHLNIFVDRLQQPPKRPSAQLAVFQSVCDSLLQTYVSLLSSSGSSDNHTWSTKAIALLQHPFAVYDVDQALVLCKQNNFSEGLLALYEKEGLYRDMLEYYIERQEGTQLLRICEEFG